PTVAATTTARSATASTANGCRPAGHGPGNGSRRSSRPGNARAPAPGCARSGSERRRNRPFSDQGMMRRGKRGGYTMKPLKPAASASAEMLSGSDACPSPDPDSPDVDSLLKQFLQSSQLGANAAYIEDLYEQYLVDPDSVGPKWKAWFDGFKGREAGDVPHSVVIDAIAQAARAAR